MKNALLASLQPTAMLRLEGTNPFGAAMAHVHLGNCWINDSQDTENCNLEMKNALMASLQPTAMLRLEGTNPFGAAMAQVQVGDHGIEIGQD